MTELCKVSELVNEELLHASKKYGSTFNSFSEAYAVILEEFEECQEELDIIRSCLNTLWHDIRTNQPDNSKMILERMKIAAYAAVQEGVQVAAMCVKAQRLADASK